MKQELKAAIEQHYGFSIDVVKPAPRQFVAETFVIETHQGDNYFCKIIDKPLFIPNVIKSLPALHAMHELGYQKINYPLKTKEGELYVMSGQTLVVLFNYIDAPQNYDFDHFTFGQVTAEIHRLTGQVKVEVPRENFTFIHQDIFAARLQSIVNNKPRDEIMMALQQATAEHEAEIHQFYQRFLQISEKCLSADFEYVITHGDAPGNTLVKSPTDIYLIDWDNILLAPAERDVWFLDDQPEFMAGYRKVFPNYEVNLLAQTYHIYSRYFNDLVEWWTEVEGDFSTEHRQKNLKQYQEYLDHSKSWIYPRLKKL